MKTMLLAITVCIASLCAGCAGKTCIEPPVEAEEREASEERAEKVLDAIDATDAQRKTFTKAILALHDKRVAARPAQEDFKAKLLGEMTARAPDEARILSLMDAMMRPAIERGHAYVDAAVALHTTMDAEQRKMFSEYLKQDDGSQMSYEWLVDQFIEQGLDDLDATPGQRAHVWKTKKKAFARAKALSAQQSVVDDYVSRQASYARPNVEGLHNVVDNVSADWMALTKELTRDALTFRKMLTPEQRPKLDEYVMRLQTCAPKTDEEK